MRYAIYNVATGEILRTYFGKKPEIQLSQDDAFIEVNNDVSDATHYIVDGEVELKPIIPPTLEDEKTRYWGEVKTIRQKIESGGCQTLYGKVDTTPASLIRIAGASQAAQMALAAGQPWSLDWTMADNSVVTHTAQEMIDLGLAVMAHVDAAHQGGRQLRTQIEAATSIAELESIDINSGWQG